MVSLLIAHVKPKISHLIVFHEHVMNMCKKNKSFGWPRREAGGEGEPFANERFTRSLKKAACYNVGWINGDIMGISCKYHVDQWKYHGDVTKNLFVMGK